MENYSDLHDICVKVFNAVATTASIFVVPLFLMRIVFSNVLGEGSKAFAILKSAVLYFCLIAAFPIIIETLFSIPESYLPKFTSMSALTNDSPEWNSSSIIPFAVDRILEVVLAGLYWIAYYLHIFFMLIMCSMAPVVFLSSTLLGLGLGFELFIGLLIVGSSWPIIWYGFDQVHTHLVSAQTDQFGAKCLELLLTLFKGLAPVAFAAVVVKSPPGKTIAKAAQGSISAGKWFVANTASAKIRNISTIKSLQTSPADRSRSNGQQTSGSYSFGKSDNRLEKAKRQMTNPENKQPKQERSVKNEDSRPRDIQT